MAEAGTGGIAISPFQSRMKTVADSGPLIHLRQVLDQLIDSVFFLDPHGTLYREALRLVGEA